MPALSVVEGSRPYPITPSNITQISALTAYISSFPLLHVDIWLSLNKPAGKGDYGLVHKFGCGNTGGVVSDLPWMELPMKPTDVIYLNYWAHNMNKTPYDFHSGYVIYYD